jgi:hypothetical protein
MACPASGHLDGHGDGVRRLGWPNPCSGLPRLRRSGHPRSRAYAARRTALGNRRKEILRCVKRALARELYPLILDALALPRPS